MATATSLPGAVAPGLPARQASAATRVTAVETVIAAMKERLDRPFELNEMARIVYLSPCYFNRVFRGVTGLPPRRFQMTLRMVAAKRLLLTTDLSVTEVSLEVGYRSLGTFTTHFHELVGVSPRALRRLGERPWTVPLPAVARESQADRSAAIRGGIAMPDGTPRLVFVGVFADPSPQGVPAACTLRAGGGRYEIAGVPPGQHHVAAAALPVAERPLDYLLPDERSVLVAASPRVRVGSGATAVRDLLLRHKRMTDPPILLAPHVLLRIAGGTAAAA